jgi:hypothetical protein
VLLGIRQDFPSATGGVSHLRCSVLGRVSMSDVRCCVQHYALFPICGTKQCFPSQVTDTSQGFTSQVKCTRQGFLSDALVTNSRLVATCKSAPPEI